MAQLPVELDEFLAAHDYSDRTVEAIRYDIAAFVRYFVGGNNETFALHRISTSDIAGFRNHQRDVRRLSVSSVNRALVSLRRFLGYLTSVGKLPANPAKGVKEIKRAPSVPKGLTAAEVRRVLRETELRGDLRANACLKLMALAGLRVSDVINLEIGDVMIAPRSGHVVCRRGKGNKQRSCPLSSEARQALSAYLEVRPPIESARIFVGERGPLTADGVRSICSKYAAITGVSFTPHTLRHTMAHAFLQATNNDLVALAQILGHENLNTTAIYTKRSQDDLQERVDQVRYG